MDNLIWEVDRQLAEISNGFDFLLYVSPVNSDSAWNAFRRRSFSCTPEFIYRPLPLDPAAAVRRLYRVPVDKIEDPLLAGLFREKQKELERKFTMLSDRGTSRFLQGSLQLYGGIEESLLNLALELLEKLPARSRDDSTGKFINAKTFAVRAKQEIAHFRKTCPEIRSKVTVRSDVTGLMVSMGNLLIGSRIKVPVARVEALIQHEVGTHILTYINGRSQPLKQLYTGLAGYEELQEGLAVLSEYLVGGLSRPRLRLLAARVLAASRMEEGASFPEVFGELNKNRGFERYTAFYITMRTFRSGGLTKDAVYLRGLVRLLEYIKGGGALEPLFIGKISADHVPVINELQLRNILLDAPLRPGYFEYPQTGKKLDSLRKGLSPLNLVNVKKQ